MIKVLILQNEISAYNVPFYNELAKKYNLTVGYYIKDKSASECSFNKHQFHVTYIRPFCFVRGVYNYCKSFDVVVTIPNLNNPNYFLLPYKRHTYAILTWSIGFRVSYVHPYVVDRPHNILDGLFMRMLNKCDASVFYMEKSKDFWRNTKLDLNKIFVAPNTTEVEKIEFIPAQKKDFIFVGTLYKGKGVDYLIKAFAKVKKERKTEIRLHIIGGGDERQNLESLVAEQGIQDSVIFHGAIFDETILSKHFQTSLLSFSPTQAGLSVPKSMGYGVPFVTRYDSITGGEIFHITNGVNGIVYRKDSDLKDIMIDAIDNLEKYIEMGLKAREYYNKYASIGTMAKGMSDAIEYAFQANKSKG